jgi:integrase/recombinase XerD
LSQEEVTRLIDSASNLSHRVMLMILYSTGVRRSELVHLKVSDIDSERTVIHIRQGKGNKDRDVPLSQKLLVALREYWRWAKPKTSPTIRRSQLRTPVACFGGDIGIKLEAYD